MVLSRHTLVLSLFVTGCAQVPAGICFSDEPCADAGMTGGGTGGGSQGGGSGGGTQGGGTGGGVQGGGAGGGVQGGGTGGGAGGGSALPNVFPSLNIPDTWSAVLNALPAPASTRPTFTAAEAVLDGGITYGPNCTEAFRGVVALPDGRALAIPFCTNRFAVIDPTAGTAEWIPQAVLSPVSQPTDPGHFGGAIFGCDGRVYALPYNDESDVLRVTPEADGGFTFVNLPTSGVGPRFLSGGVIARPCREGFRIIAAGAGGLYVLEPSETNVTVTPIAAPSFSLRFTSVARLGDDRVISATAVPASPFNLHSMTVDSNTLQSTSDTTLTDEPHVGLATRRSGDVYLIQSSGYGYPIPNGPSRQIVGAARMRWPTNSLDGWILSAGSVLAAWNEGSPPPADGVVLDPAVTDSGSFTSGGLVVTTSGALVNVPATTQRGVITIYRPTAGTPPGAIALSPWFNKL